MVLPSEIIIMSREEFFDTEMAKDIVASEKKSLSQSINYRVSNCDYIYAVELRKKLSTVEDDVYKKYCDNAKSLIEGLEKANAGDSRSQFNVGRCFMQKYFFFNPQEAWYYVNLAKSQYLPGAKEYLESMREEFEGVVDFSTDDNSPSA